MKVNATRTTSLQVDLSETTVNHVTKTRTTSLQVDLSETTVNHVTKTRLKELIGVNSYDGFEIRNDNLIVWISDFDETILREATPIDKAVVKILKQLSQ